MCSGDDEGHAASGNMVEPVIAEPIPKQDCIERFLIGLVYGILKLFPHLFAPDIVKALGMKLGFDVVGRLRDDELHFTAENLATD